jgi:hypothetical protein
VADVEAVLKEVTEVRISHGTSHHSEPEYFGEALEDAERLLKYAAETGVAVDPAMRSAILRARTDYNTGWSEEVAANLLLALTALAYALKPVTAASLLACHSQTRPTMRNYLIWAIILSAVIIPASIFMFVTSSIADAMKADITTANALAVKLTSELGPPPRADVGATTEVGELQEYAATIRSIYARANRLNNMVFPHVPVPQTLGSSGDTAAQRNEYLKDKFELKIPLANLPAERDKLTMTYQDVRFYAQNIMSDTATFYGALNSCILPILYALLGTCAYLLRSFEDQMTNWTFTPSAANSARFVIAAIGGTVIGLFGGFTTQANASPLALAFLVGYAVEVFFAFLEGLIKAFTRYSGPAAPPPVVGIGKP